MPPSAAASRAAARCGIFRSDIFHILKKYAIQTHTSLRRSLCLCVVSLNRRLLVTPHRITDPFNRSVKAFLSPKNQGS